MSLHPDIQAVMEGRSRWAVLCADSRELAPMLCGVDAVVTDPPYGIGFDYDGTYDDTRENLRALVSGVVAPLAANVPTFVFCGPSQIHEYPAPNWISVATWDTTGSFGPFGYNQWTPVLCYGPDVPGFGSVGGVLKSDCHRVTGGAGVGFQRDAIEHPCPKPLNLMTWAVGRFSEPSSVVLDPFCGSGTTGVACLRLGRRFIGIEREPKYAAIARERLEAESRGLTLKDSRLGQSSIFDVLSK